MSIIFFDGFDFEVANSFGVGGRKWDQTSGGSTVAGRFTGLGFVPSHGLTGGYSPTTKTFGSSYSSLIVGFAIVVSTFSSILYPFLTFFDNGTPQCSLWVDPNTNTITLRTGLGTSISDTTLADTGFIPPLTLWFYLEVGVTIGNPGNIEIRVDGTTLSSVGSIQTQQSGSPTTNKIAISSTQAFGTNYEIDDLYILDPNDAINNVTYLGEVRVQTQFPDAEGYQDDFLSSTASLNWTNVSGGATYSENGEFNYSGTVGAIDSYSIGNFTVSGTIFAVQSNISMRKDDVGNRSVTPLMRTAATNYTGAAFPCYSTYTYAGAMWEINPNTGVPWILTDLNNAEFGVKVYS